MLNTDLNKSHYPSSGSKKSQTKKMTKAEFINNLRGVAKGDDIDGVFLAQIYDSIEACPIVLHEGDVLGDPVSPASDDLQSSIAAMVDHGKSMDALLRGLSIHEYKFVSLQEYGEIAFAGRPKDALGDLTQKFLVKTWHQFHGLVNSALEIAHLDPKGMESCIHLLKYALCLTIIIDMPIERVAFLDQLGRFRLFNAWRQGNSGELLSKDQDCYKREEWYQRIEQQSRRSYTKYHSVQAKLESLEIVDAIVNDLGFDLASDNVDSRKALRDAVRHLESAEFLLNDPNRTFVRAGDLLKRASRSGRCVEYRFFLFSDILIYAKRIPSGGGSSTPSSQTSSSGSSSHAKYRIHEELPLILMKVVDWFPPEMKKGESKRAIQIYHPRKKVLVLCADHEERKSWVKDLRTSIDKELERKVAIEGARKAAANVPNQPAG
jgi:Sec7 domain/Pleckstrin homology domain